MGQEIERKFLVASEAWRAHAGPPRSIRQGYLASGDEANVRVRCFGTKAFLTVKSNAEGIVRQEYEYAIPARDADLMLASLCGGRIIEKKRYDLCIDGIEWIIDVFEGRLAGLVLAEVELFATDQHIKLPVWLGGEVTDDPRFRNEWLARSGSAPEL